jgi:hypothetical protein
MKPPRACCFCRQPLLSKKTREHVFPRWLLRYLSRSRITVDSTRFAPDGTTVSVRSHGLDELVLGGICGSCNHGWLSLLESQSQPILKPLISGIRSVRQLNRQERSIIARWSTKTAAVLNLSSDFDRLFVPRLVWALKESALDLPEGIHVFGGQHYPTQPSGWLQVASLELFPAADSPPSQVENSELPKTGFRIGLQLGFLCLVVAYWPQPQWPLAIWPELHEPLWPPAQTYRHIDHRYDGEAKPWDVNSQLFLYRAMVTLGAVFSLNDEILLATPKNREEHVSGLEPRGERTYLPIPNVITPEGERFIREWLAGKKSEQDRHK